MLDGEVLRRAAHSKNNHFLDLSHFGSVLIGTRTGLDGMRAKKLNLGHH